MKTEPLSSRTSSLLPLAVVIAISALLFGSFSPRLSADPGNLTPSIQFTQGLVGKQVCLRWTAQPGVQYVVQKSGTLVVTGAPGGSAFTQVALVTAEGTACQWVDPEIPRAKAFYRIEIPGPQVFAVEPPVISSAGGDIFLRAQCLPADSFLVLEIDGQPPAVVPLMSVAGQPGLWRASVAGIAGGAVAGIVVAARVVDANGVMVCLVNQPIEVTETGFATDAPPWLPPGAPVAVVKTKTKSNQSNDRMAGGDDDDCDGEADDAARFLSKRGYDYYQAQSQLNSAGAHTNPYFMESSNAGEMPSRMKAKEKANRTKCSSNLRQAGLPGEVIAGDCDLELPCPAGPPLAWVRTYRSKASVASGHGVGWDFSYNIYIEPIPLAAGVTAPRVAIHDGGGRRDVFHRQADGTYRCDGMFREGRFNADSSFTLTFADKGTWIFCPLVGAPWSGRIGSITDRNGVSLTCTYKNGQLATVSDAFGRSLSVTWDASGQISSVADSTERAVSYGYGGGGAGGGLGDLISVSCPQLGGVPPAYGPTTYTYTSGFADDRLNHNLLSATDGAGRNLGAFTYSTQANAAAVDFDTCATVRLSAQPPGTVTIPLTTSLVALPANTLPAGGYVFTVNDETGRITATTCDRQHRPVRIRQFTGLATPGVPSTPTTNLPAGKLRPTTDPDFYETTCLYNGQHLCTRVTLPDGTQERSTYACDLQKDCPVREGGNARVLTLRAPNGEERTVTMDYLSGFGSPEPSRSIKAGHYAVSNFHIEVDGKSGGYLTNSVDLPKITPKIAKESHGKFRLPLLHYASIEFASIKIEVCAAGHKTAEDMAVRILQDGNCEEGEYANVGGGGIWAGEDGEGGCTNSGRGGNPDGSDCTNHGRPKLAHLTRLTTTLGQTFTNTYDAFGNCTSSRTPIAGAGCDFIYNSLGQCTSITELNGAASSFRTDCVYDADTGFCTSVIRDPAGLHLTVSFDRDTNGRVTRRVDERGFDWLATYNAADQCTQTQTPLVGTGVTASRISTDYFYDAGGLPSGCDVEHRDATGAPVAANPAYSTRYIRESPTRPRLVSRVAVENRPVSLPPGSTDIAAAGLENFDVCDYTYNAAGECVEERTPAVCLAQPTDVVRGYQFDERGMLHRCIDGAPGTPGTVTTECDYTPGGDLSRCAKLASTAAESPTETYLYDGFRRCISSTDPMGNVKTYSYDNQGYVTCSLSGELDDAPGSAANVLLARSKLRVWQLMQGQNGSKPNKDYATDPYVEDAMRLTGRPVGQPSAAGLGTHIQRAFFDFVTEDETCTVERFTPGAASAPGLEITTFDRSPAGLVQSVSLNGDLLAAYTFDTAARAIICANGACSIARTLDASGNVIAATRTDLSSAGGNAVVGTAHTTIYDAVGSPVQMTTGSNITRRDFDSLGRIVRLSPPSGAPIFHDYDGGPPAGLYSVRTQCDVDGDGTPETLGSSYARSCPKRYKIKIDIGPPRPPIFGRSMTNSNGDTTTFTRDSQGRCVQTVFPDGTHDTSTFDNLGRASTYTRKNGAITTLDYDYKDRVLRTGVTDDNSQVVPVPPTTYRYNGLDDCTRMTQGTSDVVRTFDSCGNLLSESQNGHLVQHTYTHRGRASITYPDGARYHEVRNAQGLPVSCSAQGAPGPAIFTAQFRGYRLEQETRANGVVTTHVYRGPNDEAIPGTGADFSVDACVQTTVTDPNGTVLSRSNYNRDGSQRLIRRETLFSGASGNVSPLRRQLIARDQLGRVTRMVTGQRPTAGTPIVPESDVTYTLDLEGQRLQVVGGAHPGTYTASATLPPGDRQMHQYTKWPDGPLEWDDNGSLTLFSHGATGAHQLVYDACSRLVAVMDNGTGVAVATYGYDAEDRLISRTLPSSDPLLPPETTFFIYDGSQCIVELGGDGLPDLTFAGIGHCIISRNGTYVYPHGGGTGTHFERRSQQKPFATSDRRSSFTQLMTGSTGAPVERFDLDDGGQPIFLNGDGLVRQGATTALTGYRWILRYSSSTDLNRLSNTAWCPESELLMCPGGTYSPGLGQDVSAHKEKPKPKEEKPHKKEYTGHVTLLK